MLRPPAASRLPESPAAVAAVAAAAAAAAAAASEDTARGLPRVPRRHTAAWRGAAPVVDTLQGGTLATTAAAAAAAGGAARRGDATAVSCRGSRVRPDAATPGANQVRRAAMAAGGAAAAVLIIAAAAAAAAVATSAIDGPSSPSRSASAGAPRRLPPPTRNVAHHPTGSSQRRGRIATGEGMPYASCNNTGSGCHKVGCVHRKGGAKGMPLRRWLTTPRVRMQSRDGSGDGGTRR